MLKKFLTVLLFLTALCFKCFAEVKQNYDRFSGVKDIYSSTTQTLRDIKPDGNPFAVVIFDKSSKFGVGITLRQFNIEKLFSNADLQMKIDEDEIVSLPILGTRIEKGEVTKFITAGYWDANKVIDKIAQAKKITIRVYYSNQPDITWTLPDKVLKEWQEVLQR